jgi:alpha-L-fucosidase
MIMASGEAGGAWDAEDWVAAANASRAGFTGPLAEHHDGYFMWGLQGERVGLSRVWSWNRPGQVLGGQS